MSITGVQEALAAAAALRTAAHLGVADRLGAAPLDARGLARECGLSDRGSRVLLAALAALDVVEPTTGGRYRAAPAAELVGAAVELFDRLPDAVRTGRPAQAWDTGQVAAEVYPRLVPLLADTYGSAAERAADAVTGPHQRVLDLAAGAAPWSLPLAAGASTTSVTALDLPDVLLHARRAVKERGLEDRYRFLAGDAFVTDLEGPYDVVLVANFCHLFGAEANLRLLRRLRRVLIPGGRLGIIDVVPGEARGLPPRSAFHELSLLLRTSAGAEHHFSAYVDWLTRCGYRSVERVELDPPAQLALVLATLD